MKFPKRLRHNGKGRVLATIYKRPDCYRLYWRQRVDGIAKSRFKDFTHYGAAKREGDKLTADLAKGKPSALSPGQTSDALAACERLRELYRSTGRKFSLLLAVSEFAENVAKVHAHGRALGEAVDGFLANAATVKRKDVKEAVEQFLLVEEPRTKAADGKRPEVSPKYHYIRALILRRFAGAFPNTALCDLTKQHLNTFMTSLAKLPTKSRNKRLAVSAKSRNHHRATVRQFLSWAVRNDYLSATHRLNQADGMRSENGNTSEILFYTPAELKALLDAAKGPLRAMVAIGGLAGLRTQELLRLTWEDVRRVENHIEVSSGKAKTRQRRLVEVVPALAQWLAQYPDATGKVWTLHEITFQQHFGDLCAKARVEVKGKKVPVTRKPNGLRHSFCTYHFALHGNENLTAQQAGNSPQMLHANYKGLVTRKEGERWFAVGPDHAENVIDLSAKKGA